MDEANLKAVLQSEGIDLPESFFLKLPTYARLLAEWNEKMNLTAITESGAVYEKHFLDCLLLLKNRDLNNKAIGDLGSGAGFPGMLLALAVPSAKVTLVDATKKKFLFLEEVKKTLQIPNVEFHIGRAEDMKEFREYFDILTCRGFAALNIFLEVAAPLTKRGGTILAMKGAKAEEELDQAQKAIRKLNLKFIGADRFILPECQETRIELSFKKTGPTDKKYPRPWKDILERPL